MSQDDRATDGNADHPEGDGEHATSPPSEDPVGVTHRRAKLVLADSTPPPPPDEALAGDSAAQEGEQREDAPLSSPSSDEARDVYLNKVIANRYEVEAYLGRGSMGTVYRCRHRVLDKCFAIKIIREELAREAEAVSRFVTEAKAASAIGSKHIVEVLDFGELPDGAAYIVMEYLEGTTLYRQLELTPRMPVARALDIAIQIADGVSAAHAATVVHRDLKPDNIFVVKTAGGRDFVKILDFGIAKILRSGSKLTQAGSVMGTPAYMSPEQALGSATDARTDIYSLGIMLYEMVAGGVPFDAENPLAVLSMQVTDTPPRLADRLPSGEKLPPGYEAVVAKCLAKKPHDRFQSMDEVKVALEKLARGAHPDVTMSDAPHSASGRRSFSTLREAFSGKPAELEVELTDDDVAPLHPLRSRQKQLLVGGSVVILLGAAVAVFAASGDPSPATAPSASAPSVAPPPPAPVATPAPAADLKEVHLILFPLDAHAFDGKRDLGMMPITITLQPGEVKHLTVTRRGYITRRLLVDGSRERMVVGLVVEGAKGAAQAQRAADLAAEKAAAAMPQAAEGKKPAGEKPADKPSEKPADKPSEKPADKPPEKPADKPPEKPADDQRAPEAPAKAETPPADPKPAASAPP